MAQPRITQLHTWERHVEIVLEVLTKALQLLSEHENLDQKEDDISRTLYRYVDDVNAFQLLRGRGLFHPITYQCQNPPHPDDDHTSPRERNKPDFYWDMYDMVLLMRDSKRGRREFVIECKRLGTARQSKDYIREGVRRFTIREEGYGMGANRGAMIGYIQSSELDEILQQVNAAATLETIPHLSLSTDGWQKNGTSQLDHEFTRPFPVSPYHLRHLWVDLRNNY